MKIRRYFSQKDAEPYNGLSFRRVEVGMPAGGTRYVSAPATWTVGATQAFSNHALLKAPLPGARRQRHEPSLPRDLRRHEILQETSNSPEDRGHSETDVRSAIDRVTGSLARSGLDAGYFETTGDAVTFRDELRALICTRRVTFSAQTWQKLGMAWAYGIDDRAEANDPTARPAPSILSSGGFLSRVADHARRNQDAAALAMGRSSLADITKKIKSAIADGGADPVENVDLRAALADAEMRGLPASAARQLIDAFVAGDESWPDADTHLDADSDIWDMVDTPAPYTVHKTAACGEEGLEDLALASFRGEAPELLFDEHADKNRLTTATRSPVDDVGEPAAGGFTPTGAISLLGFALKQGQDAKTPNLDIDELVHAVRLLTIALDIAHTDAGSGGKGRPIAICPTDLAAYVMSCGAGYASEEGRALAATVCALLSASALATSAQLASRLGNCPAFSDSCDSVARFIGTAQRLLLGQPDTLDGSQRSPEPLYPHSADHARVLHAAKKVLDRAAIDMKDAGLRNLALTRMSDDADMADMLAAESQGLSPVHTLVKYRHLTPELDPKAIYKVVSPAVPAALRALHHDDASIDRILDHVIGTGSLAGAPGVNHDLLRERGISDEDIEIAETALATAANIRAVFTPYILGWDGMADGGDDLLTRLGFSDWDIEHANYFCCGALTLEGSRDLPHEHLPVFDCDEPLGEIGTRRINMMDRMLMARAVQPFLTDRLTLDLELPTDSTIESIEKLYRYADELGLPSIRLNRAGSSLSEPMDYDDLLDGQADAISHAGHADLDTNVYVRSVEVDEAVATREANNGAADALTLAISVGLKHGIPMDAFQEAFASFGSMDAKEALSSSLTSMADSYLVSRPTQAEVPQIPISRSTWPDHAPGHSDTGYLANQSEVSSLTDEIGGRPSISAPSASRTPGDPALSPPSVSGRHREK